MPCNHRDVTTGLRGAVPSAYDLSKFPAFGYLIVMIRCLFAVVRRRSPEAILSAFVRFVRIPPHPAVRPALRS